MKLGQICVTAGVHQRMSRDKAFSDFVTTCLNERFRHGDWGDICEEDCVMNDLSVKNNDDRILASYQIPDDDDEKLWIITEWDHSVTTILFASEY